MPDLRNVFFLVTSNLQGEITVYMNKNCFPAYASSFCNVKLLSAGLAAVITSLFYDSVYLATDLLFVCDFVP